MFTQAEIMRFTAQKLKILPGGIFGRMYSSILLRQSRTGKKKFYKIVRKLSK